ncbi:MAG: hypothetical protein JRG94_08735 [Deltaproteobacteria bacterium]|nr:hypothetical protein [Deltaproteobacteria bacterium]
MTENGRRIQITESFGISRRGFLHAGLVAGVSIALPFRAHGFERSKALGEAIEKSTLVYVTPLLSNGSESRCHAEVWFADDAGDLLVVTNPERWRAAAISRGLKTARLWVGDYGLWKKSAERYREAPGCVAQGRIESDPAVHARALEVFGKKYTAEWDKWGPRFKDGLASGDRVLIRYTPSAN